MKNILIQRIISSRGRAGARLMCLLMIFSCPISGEIGSSDFTVPSLLQIEPQALSDKTTISLLTNGTIDYQTFFLSDPDRFIIDLLDMINELPQERYAVGSAIVSQVRAAQFQMNPQFVTRIVIDLNERREPDVQTQGHEMMISFPEPGQSGHPAIAEEEHPEESSSVEAVPENEKPGASSADSGGNPFPDDAVKNTGESPAFIEPAPLSEENPEDESLPEMTITGQPEEVDTPPPVDTGSISEPKLSPPSEERQPLVTNMFYETSVRQALADISAQTGVTIIPDETVRGFVTCEFVDAPLDKALEIVLSVGGFYFRRMNGFILVGSANPESPVFYTISEMRDHRLNHLKAEDAVAMLPENFARFVRAHPTENLICITAPPKLLERIIHDVKILDRAPRQVVLEARVVEFTKIHGRELGIDWSYQWQKPVPGSDLDIPAEGGLASWDSVTGMLGLGYTTSADFTHSLLMRLSLMVDNHWATILANPRISTQDRQNAVIRVMEEEYFIILAEGTYVRSELEKIESGIILEVTPYIGDNDEITLELKPEVSNVVAEGEQGLPIVTRRQVSTTVRVKNGGTVIIAGLLHNRSRKSETGLAGVSKIPLFGAFFRKSDTTDLDRQIAVFITPRIIETDLIETGLPREPSKQAQLVGKAFREQLKTSLRQDNRD